MSAIVSPDCRDQNHQKCPGDAWDEAHDHATECQCTCHAIGDYPALQAAHAAYKRHLNTGELTTLEGALAAALTAAAPIMTAQAKVEALREAANDSRVGPVPYGWNASGVASWLRDRAAAIEGKVS